MRPATYFGCVSSCTTVDLTCLVLSRVSPKVLEELPWNLVWLSKFPEDEWPNDFSVFFSIWHCHSLIKIISELLVSCVIYCAHTGVHPIWTCKIPKNTVASLKHLPDMNITSYISLLVLSSVCKICSASCHVELLRISLVWLLVECQSLTML